MEYGIQLYSVRDLAKESLEDSVRKMAELGYSSVEFAGFYDRTAEQINALMNETGLKISGTHSPFDDLVDRYEETVAYHKAIGNQYYIIPGYKLNTQERLDVFIEKVNRISKKLKEDGITLVFHNHAHEFKLNEDGSLIFDQLLYRTDLMFEIDTYWAFVGMKNPIALLERIRDRVCFIHIKDGYANGNGMPLGMGEAPLKDVYHYAADNGIPMVVESETCNPDGVTEAMICMNYLKSCE